ncbi:hypothetical protein OSCT_2265 [Oscillochloris trichoides DG-6]|uniref:Uncharacterized protein n=1 Tax=Oscillochloris trichoides DG-6 TaxID=765420 RepID=E1IG01_9CHLR|nr:hypothetical protein [Oscillochloris trichoides]EFO79890.1 hypothetical protein OSCT_2265 [Oscillochloris trichoides DG-6]
MPLAFAPTCLPLLRGGLPHANAHDALALVAATTPAIPAWPALYGRSFRERPLAQAAAGFPGVTIDPAYERISVDHAAAEIGLDRLGLAYLRAEPGAGALPADYAAGLGELLRLVGHGHQARALKGEVLGPVSLALQLTDEDDRPLAYDQPLRESLLHHLALRVAWHYEQLSTYVSHVILCLDEPFLDALDLPLCPLERDAGIEMLARLLADMPGCRGLAVCGAVDWEHLLDLPVDLVLFDAYQHGAELIEAAKTVARFIDRGGLLGWGIVPTDPATLAQEQPATLAHRVDRAVDYLAAASGMERRRILDAALITSNQSLATLTMEVAEEALQMCAATSRSLRERNELV